MGIFRIDDGFIGQLQRPNEGLFQFRQEMQRAAQEGDTTADGFTAGQTGNSLIDHGLENGRRKVGLCCPLIDERLNVGLGKYTAAGGDGVDLAIRGCGFIKAGGIGL